MRACAFLENPRGISFVASRLIYVVYICLAIFPIGNLVRLMDGLKVCVVEVTPKAPSFFSNDAVMLAAYFGVGSGPSGSGGGIEEHCETLGPIMGACVTSAIASALALIAYSVVDYKSAGDDYTRGLLVGAGACIVLMLIQSTSNFFAVGKLVQHYNNDEGGNDVGSYGTLLATGARDYQSYACSGHDEPAS